MLSNQKKRRHHYVWKKYLKPWTVNNKIWCKRYNNLFQTNTINVGVEVDYYKIRELNQFDLNVIYTLAIEPLTPYLKKVNEKWITLYNYVYKIKNFVDFNNVKSNEIDQALDILIHNLDEDLHSEIERVGSSYINKIFNYDLSFFKKDQEFSDFIYYLTTQYFRTLNRKSKLEKAMKKFENVKVDKIWNILTHIFSTNMSANMFVKRKSFNIYILKNISELEFITGDQPIINTFASGLQSSKAPEELEFYYPLSPDIAILINQKKLRRENIIEIQKEQVDKYNNQIIEQSLNQIYAKSKNTLINYNIENM